MTDFESFIERLAPKSAHYRHNDFHVRTVHMHEDECPNGHSHCQNLVLGTSESIPISDSKMVLGQWQRIFVIELDSDKHLASKNARDDKYGFILQNPKQLRIPIPCNGQLNFFDFKPELTKIDEIKNDLFEDEHRYMWINHH